MKPPTVLRRRQVSSSKDTQETQFLTPKWTKRIQKLDAYTKVDDDQFKYAQTKTAAGGVVSVLTMSILFLLVLVETYAFVFPARREHLKVDTSNGGQIEISFHLTLHAITCAEAHVDAMDVSGEQQVNVVQSILKQRLDQHGNLIGREFADTDLQPKMYIRMPGIGIMSLIGSDHRIPEQRANQEGCSLRGSLFVNKCEGNFHIAVGRSHKSSGHHVHNFKMSDLMFFNTSHTIHELSFGATFTGMSKPLDGISKIVSRKDLESPDLLVSGLYQYYSYLTPTTFIGPLGLVTRTYQQSVTEHFRRLLFADGLDVEGMPGVFFMYKLSPFSLLMESDRVSFMQFMTNTCAIVGGVFAVSSIIDRLLHVFGSFKGQNNANFKHSLLSD